MAPKSGKKPPRTSPAPDVLWGPVRYSGKHHLSSSEEDHGHPGVNFVVSNLFTAEGLIVPKTIGSSVSATPMVPAEVIPFPVRFSAAMGIKGQQSTYSHVIDKQPFLVASAQNLPNCHSIGSRSRPMPAVPVGKPSAERILLKGTCLLNLG